MKAKNIIFFAAAVVVIVSLIYSFIGSGDQSAYIEEINKEREEKDRFMKSSKSLLNSLQSRGSKPLPSLQIRAKNNDTWNMPLPNLTWMAYTTNC